MSLGKLKPFFKLNLLYYSKFSKQSFSYFRILSIINFKCREE